MKIQKEKVVCDQGRSFKIFAPRLRNNFFWHYHPEYELVYVEAVTGICHVGKHISSYMNSALVMIGPNVPHLNFDYGIKTDYRQVVVQLKQDFLGTVFSVTPEFQSIHRLFGRASLGLSFSGATKQKVAAMLAQMSKFDHFHQLVHLLEIFQVLAQSNEVMELNYQDTSIKLFFDDKIRMGSVYKYIHEKYNERPDVNEVAANVHLSTPAFCRYFKKQTNMTFTEFVNQYRITQAKTLLMKGVSVSEACYECGFESMSYFNKLFNKNVGINPSKFSKQQAKVII